MVGKKMRRKGSRGRGRKEGEGERKEGEGERKEGEGEEEEGERQERKKGRERRKIPGPLWSAAAAVCTELIARDGVQLLGDIHTTLGFPEEQT